MRIENDTRAIMEAHGIHTPAIHFAEDSWRGAGGLNVAFDSVPSIAFDAQPGLITTANSAIPALFTTIADPQVVRVLQTPTRAAEVFGETKRGDWTTAYIEFPFVEPTGETSTYGDWNVNGSVGANVNWMPRQSYAFQIVAQWGEREMARYGAAGIDYLAQVEMAGAIAMTQFQNKSYLYGVNGLLNYGALNDPNLVAPISPLTKAAGGALWANATAVEVFNDVNALFNQLVVQSNGIITDSSARMKLVIPTASVSALNKVSAFNVSARQTITETFPNLTIEAVPQYTTAGGNLAQLLIEDYEGVQTAFCAFTEKQRSHAVVTDLSGWKQKKSGGTWGWVNRRSFLIAQMLGI